MNCPVCGYVLNAFEAECPKCHGFKTASQAPQHGTPAPASTGISYEQKMLVCIGIFVVAGLNFFLFMAITLYLGGDALNGKIEAGKYLVCDPPHCTEVSQAVFNYSKYHAYSLGITHPAGMIAAVYYKILNKKWEQQQS